MTNRADNSLGGGERAQTLQVQLTAQQMGLVLSVPESGSVQSYILPSNGYLNFAIGLTSNQAGTISIQRFIDLSGNVPQGAPITASLTGSTAQVANITSDGHAFSSLQITVTNTSGSSAATLSNVAALWQSCQ